MKIKVAVGEGETAEITIAPWNIQVVNKNNIGYYVKMIGSEVKFYTTKEDYKKILDYIERKEYNDYIG